MKWKARKGRLGRIEFFSADGRFLIRRGRRPPDPDRPWIVTDRLARRFLWSATMGGAAKAAKEVGYVIRWTYRTTLLTETTFMVSRVFDDSLIMTPYTYGELFPRVDVPKKGGEKT